MLCVSTFYPLDAAVSSAVACSCRYCCCLLLSSLQLLLLPAAVLLVCCCRTSYLWWSMCGMTAWHIYFLLPPRPLFRWFWNDTFCFPLRTFDWLLHFLFPFRLIWWCERDVLSCETPFELFSFFLLLGKCEWRLIGSILVDLIFTDNCIDSRYSHGLKYHRWRAPTIMMFFLFAQVDVGLWYGGTFCRFPRFFCWWVGKAASPSGWLEECL